MLSVSERNLAKAKLALIRLDDGLRDLSPLMDWIGENVSSNTVERFHTAKDPDGKDWTGLAEITVKQKRRKEGRGDGKKILVDSGTLMNSITHTADSKSAFIFSDDANQDKVAAHQFGNAAKNLPKRAIFGLSNKDSEEIKDQTVIWIEGLF